VYGFLWVFKTTQIILNLFICCFFCRISILFFLCWVYVLSFIFLNIF
jgi:hypothetical protein